MPEAENELRSVAEIRRAHDRLSAILLGEVPNPFSADPFSLKVLTAACDALCWALHHDYNQTFGNNLRMIDEFMSQQGLTLVEENSPDPDGRRIRHA